MLLGGGGGGGGLVQVDHSRDPCMGGGGVEGNALYRNTPSVDRYTHKTENITFTTPLAGVIRMNVSLHWPRQGPSPTPINEWLVKKCVEGPIRSMFASSVSESNSDSESVSVNKP